MPGKTLLLKEGCIREVELIEERWDERQNLNLEDVEDKHEKKDGRFNNYTVDI